MPDTAAVRVTDAAGLRDALTGQPAPAQVYVGGFANHPAELARALVDMAGSASRTTASVSIPAGLPTPLKSWGGRVVLTHSIDGFEDAIAAGRAAFRPVHLSELAAQLRAHRPRVTFLRVAPPDRDGRCHLGFSVDTTLDAVHGGELVVAEFDPSLPRAAGDCWIPADQIFLGVEAAPLPPRQVSRTAASPAETQIACRVAELIPDGATVELGMGRVPDVIADSLHDHRDLRLHTGIVTSSVVRLLGAGAVDESPPPLFLAPVAAIMGTNDADVRAALSTDPRIELHPASTTHDRRFLGALPDFHAVNGALGVALDGSVNCEFSGTRRVAAVGGLMDFREGARQSPGGKFVVALTSTTSSGASRIVPALHRPATVPAADAGWVVTEFGAIDLGPLDSSERAAALIELAHPAHRDALASARP